MKVEPITKLDQRSTTTSEKFDDDFMPENCDVIVIFAVFDQLVAIRKPDSGNMVYKTYIFINSNLLSYT